LGPLGPLGTHNTLHSLSPLHALCAGVALSTLGALRPGVTLRT
jgi:hypothetical protein